MDTWTDEHARLVVAAATPVDDTDLDRVWARVAAEIDEDRAPVNRRRRLRMAVGAGATALVLGISGVAAADFISARTGQRPTDGEDSRLGGPGERLDPSAADFRHVLVEEVDDIPFPNETARRVSIDEHVRDMQGTGDPEEVTRVSTGALRAWTAIHAVCSWANEWVVTERDGNAARHVEAGRMLVEARHWTAITDIDSEQSTRMIDQEVLRRDGTAATEVVPDPTQFFYLRQVSTAVQADDVASLAIALAENAYCIGPSLVPDFPQALPPGFRGR